VVLLSDLSPYFGQELEVERSKGFFRRLFGG
jgi:hypothetical protein